MERRLFELVEPLKEIFHEAGNTAIPISVGRPIIDRQDLRHPDRLHGFARLKQIGIVLRRKFGRNIIILQIPRIRHRQEVESRLRLELHEKVCRLAGDMHDTRDFTCSHLFECD